MMVMVGDDDVTDSYEVDQKQWLQINQTFARPPVMIQGTLLHNHHHHHHHHHHHQNHQQQHHHQHQQHRQPPLYSKNVLLRFSIGNSGVR